MHSDRNDIAPVQAAQSLTPWWMTRIQEFDGLEIQPCKVVGFASEDREIMAPCEPEYASFWTVYGHYKPVGACGGVDAFEDFKTEAEARKFHDRLLAVYPHLSGEKKQFSRQQPRKEFAP
ncbi:MAG: hypothetical protein PHY92_00035 [Alphaproteobacteria bacterium]|nr:hypothetical protein [Alphaproteobacteria bacterium]